MSTNTIAMASARGHRPCLRRRRLHCAGNPAWTAVAGWLLITLPLWALGVIQQVGQTEYATNATFASVKTAITQVRHSIVLVNLSMSRRASAAR